MSGSNIFLSIVICQHKKKKEKNEKQKMKKKDRNTYLGVRRAFVVVAWACALVIGWWPKTLGIIDLSHLNPRLVASCTRRKSIAK